MKHTRAIIITLFTTVLVTAFSLTAFAAYIESPWIYDTFTDESGNTGVRITGYTGAGEDAGEGGAVKVPWNLGGMEIKEVEKSAFDGSGVKVVEVPENAESTGDAPDGVTFGTYKLMNVPDPDNPEDLADPVQPIINPNESDNSVRNNGTSTNSSSGNRGSAYKSETNEIVIAAPDVGYELEEIPSEMIEEPHLPEENSIRLVMDEDGGLRDAAEIEAENSDAVSEAGDVSVQSEADSEAETVISTPSDDARSAFGGLTAATKKTLAIVIAASLAVLAIAGGVYIFVIKKS